MRSAERFCSQCIMGSCLQFSWERTIEEKVWLVWEIYPDKLEILNIKENQKFGNYSEIRDCNFYGLDLQSKNIFKSIHKNSTATLFVFET